jgi:hypothetical protein
MQIRIRDTGAVVQEYGFRLLHSNTSFSALSAEILDAFNADFLLQGVVPAYGRYQTVVESGVEQIEGKWYTKYSVADMDADVIAAKDTEQAKAILSQRTDKLKDSDWTQVADAPVDQAAWATYRQALRDITAQPGFPWDTQWPDAPV